MRTVQWRSINLVLAVKFGTLTNLTDTLREMTTLKLLKFNPTVIDYHLSLKPQSNRVPHMDQLCEIFDSVVYEMTNGMAQ